MPGESNPDDLLLSDDERMHALEAVSAHFASGRLATAEFYDRSGEIAAARTVGDLSAPFTGLPGGVPLVVIDGHVRLAAGPETAPAVQNAGEVVADADSDEDELATLRKRGETVETIDWLIIGITLMTFLILQFVVDWSNAWMVWPTLIVTLSIPRMILKYSDADEEVYDELKESDAAARKERLRLAAERIRELEDPNGQG